MEWDYSINTMRGRGRLSRSSVQVTAEAKTWPLRTWRQSTVTVFMKEMSYPSLPHSAVFHVAGSQRVKIKCREEKA